MHREVEQSKARVTKQTLSTIAGLFEQQSVAYKTFASASALIDTYQAAESAYMSTAKIPIVGPGLAPIAAAAAVAAGLQNVAKINGIQFHDGGMIHGASHAEGGVPFTVAGAGGFEAEGGEFIVNRKATAMFLPEITRMNEIGKRFYASGGMLPTMAGQSQTVANVDTQLIVDSISDAIRATPVVVSAQRVRDGLREVSVISGSGDL